MLNLTAVWTLPGAISRSAISRGIAELVGRHETLRTRYVAVEGTDELAQQIVERPRFDVSTIKADDEEWTAYQKMTNMPRQVADFFDQEFVVTDGLNWKVAIVEVDGRCRHVCFVCHHIVADMAGLSILADELMSLLGGAPVKALPKPVLQPRVLAELERSNEGSDESQRVVRFWRSQLRNIPSLAVHHREATHSTSTNRTLLYAKLNTDLTLRQMIDTAKIYGASVDNLILALMAMSLSKQFDSATHIPIRTVCWNRFTPAKRTLVGNIAQATLVVVVVSPSADLYDYIGRVRRTVLPAYRSAHFDHRTIDNEREATERTLGAEIDVPFTLNSQIDRRIYRPRHGTGIVRTSDEFVQLPSVELVAEDVVSSFGYPGLNLITRSDGYLSMQIDVDSAMGGQGRGSNVAESVLHTIRQGLEIIADGRAKSMTVAEINEQIETVKVGFGFS